jgi:hypothetical protein
MAVSPLQRAGKLEALHAFSPRLCGTERLNYGVTAREVPEPSVGRPGAQTLE